jgi:hypothetical protein
MPHRMRICRGDKRPTARRHSIDLCAVRGTFFVRLERAVAPPSLTACADTLHTALPVVIRTGQQLELCVVASSDRFT